VGAVVAVVLGTTLGALLTGTGGRAPATEGATTALFTAAGRRTLAQRTARLVLTGWDGVSGTTVSVAGSGWVNFATGSLSEVVHSTGGARQVEAKELIANRQVLLDESVDGSNVLSPLSSCAEWLQYPSSLTAVSAMIGLGTGNPIAELRSLAGPSCAAWQGGAMP
jgi:hypothetical protein